MRVLVISSAFPPMECGEATNTFFLCQKLIENGLEVHLLTSRRTKIYRMAKLKLYPVMNKWYWKEIPIFIRVLKKVKPESVLLIYFEKMYNNHPMATYIPSIVKKVVKGTKVVTRYEQTARRFNEMPLLIRLGRKMMSTYFGKNGTDYLEGTLIRDSDKLITLCSYHADYLNEISPVAKDKTYILPPSPNIKLVPDSKGSIRRSGRVRIGAKADDIVFAYMGYVYTGKGIDILLKAFEIISKKRTNTRLIIIGGEIEKSFSEKTSYFEYIKKLSNELGLLEKIYWTGTLNATDLDWAVYLHAADIGVLPLDDGVRLNNSSFSSMASYGLPIIVTKGKNCETALIHEENVFLTEARNHIDLAKGMEKMADDSELRKRIKIGCSKMYYDLFEWNNAVARTINLLK